MRKIQLIFTMALGSFLVAVFVVSAAASPGIGVSTDKTEYYPGETVVITCHWNPYSGKQEMGWISVYDPSGVNIIPDRNPGDNDAGWEFICYNDGGERIFYLELSGGKIIIYKEVPQPSGNPISGYKEKLGEATLELGDYTAEFRKGVNCETCRVIIDINFLVTPELPWGTLLAALLPVLALGCFALFARKSYTVLH